MDNYIHINNQAGIDECMGRMNNGIIYVSIQDWPPNQIVTVPDEFLDHFPDLEGFSFDLDNAELPSSLFNCSKLKSIRVTSNTYKALPEKFNLLKTISLFELGYNNKQFNWPRAFPILAQLPLLKYLELRNFRGTVFPKEIVQMKQLESLKIGTEVFKKMEADSIITVLAGMKHLKNLELDYRHKIIFKIPENILLMDFMDEITIPSYRPLILPGFLALIRHVKLNISVHRGSKQKTKDKGSQLYEFTQAVSGHNLTDHERRLLFIFWTDQLHTLREMIPNKLLEEGQPSFKIKITGSIKRDRLKQLENSLENTVHSIVKNDASAADLHVVTSTASFEEVIGLVENHIPFILEDQLNDYVNNLGDQYLRAPENEELNEELVRLFVSNQVENYLLAFQIIEGGGAGKTIQSLLAAVYLAQPDKKVQKAAEKLFVKYCSVAYQEYLKMTQGKISLRRSASSKMGYGILSTHPDINRMEFILMYHRIAGDNPIIKDVSPAVLDLKQQEITELPLLIKFFDGIRNINLEKNPSFDLEKSLPALKVAHNITGLNFAGNRIKVPDLSFLPSLKILDLSFNSVGDCSWLQHLSLEELNIEGCNVDSWEWLNKKNTIKVLNISGNKMDAVPEGVFAGSLTKFTCRNNKLTVIDPRFGEAEKLDEIDLAGNQIKEFSYFLLDKTIVNLRSNKIGEFDHSKYIAGNTWQEIRIMRLDLVNNELKELVFGPLMLKRLYDLKISNNKIFRLDDSVFNNTNLHIFEATNNEIEAVPESVMQHEYKNFWLNKNKIRELPEYLNALRAADIDLSDNRIEKIHPSFFTIKQGSNRHYWKISGNPVSKDPAFNWHDFIYPGKE